MVMVVRASNVPSSRRRQVTTAPRREAGGVDDHAAETVVLGPVVGGADPEGL